MPKILSLKHEINIKLLRFFLVFLFFTLSLKIQHPFDTYSTSQCGPDTVCKRVITLAGGYHTGAGIEGQTLRVYAANGD